MTCNGNSSYLLVFFKSIYPNTWPISGQYLDPRIWISGLDLRARIVGPNPGKPEESMN